jgi:hypothetical protein
MQAPSGAIPVIFSFHYLNGKVESFNVPLETVSTTNDLQQMVRRILEHPWWTLHTETETIFVNLTTVTKIEVHPTMAELQGEAIFGGVQRVKPIG